MSGIVRVRKSKESGNYSTIHNVGLHDKTLSWSARGLLAYLLTKPNDWQVRMADLMAGSPDGLRVVRRCLKELQDAGYVDRRRIQDDKGQFSWETIVFEMVQPSVQSVSMEPSAQKPSMGYPSAVNPSMDNVPIYKELNLLSTELLSTELKECGAQNLNKGIGADAPREIGLPLESSTRKPKVKTVYVHGSIVALDELAHVAAMKCCNVGVAATPDKKRSVEEACRDLMADGATADDFARFQGNWWRFKCHGAYHGKAPTAKDLRDHWDEVLHADEIHAMRNQEKTNEPKRLSRSERDHENTRGILQVERELAAIVASRDNATADVRALPEHGRADTREAGEYGGKLDGRFDGRIGDGGNTPDALQSRAQGEDRRVHAFA